MTDNLNDLKNDAGVSLKVFGDPASPGVRTGLLAAETLERVCRDHEPEEEKTRLKLYLDSVEELSRSLGTELKALSERIEARAQDESRGSSGDSGGPGSELVSAALRAADLATLAACALPELPRGGTIYLRSAEAARLAAVAAQSVALEHRALERLDGSGAPEDYATLDLRGAEWRAGLAARQVEEMLREEG